MIRQLMNVTLKRSIGSSSEKLRKFTNMYNRKNLRHDHYLKFPRYFKAMRKLVDDQHMARMLLFQNKIIFDQPEQRIHAIANLCQKWKIDLTDLASNSKLLTMSEREIENRIMVLEEMGITKIDVEMVVSFGRLMNSRMSIIMAATGIPDSKTMTERMIEYFGPVPPEVPPLEEFSDSLSCQNYRAKCVHWYLSWKLNVPKENQEWFESTAPVMREKSFRLLRDQIDFYLNTVGMSESMMLKFFYLFAYSKPEELLRIIEEVKTFGGVELLKLMRLYQPLHKMKYDNVVKVLKILKKNKFTEKMMRNYPFILLIPYEKLKKALKYCNKIPELRALRNNTKILYLLDHIDVVKARLEYLHYHNIRHVSVYILTGPREQVERVFISGIDGTYGREISLALKPYMNITHEEIVQRLRKHPFWRRVDIVAVTDTVQYLLERFSPKDITNNIQIVLYSKEKIAETLKELPELTENDERVYKKDILAYCLYDIEKTFHFSGDGVWRHQPAFPRDNFRREVVEAQLEVSDSESTDEDEKVTSTAPKSK